MTSARPFDLRAGSSMAAEVVRHGLLGHAGALRYVGRDARLRERSHSARSQTATLRHILVGKHQSLQRLLRSDSVFAQTANVPINPAGAGPISLLHAAAYDRAEASREIIRQLLLSTTPHCDAPRRLPQGPPGAGRPIGTSGSGAMRTSGDRIRAVRPVKSRRRVDDMWMNGDCRKGRARGA